MNDCSRSNTLRQLKSDNPGLAITRACSLWWMKTFPRWEFWLSTSFLPLHIAGNTFLFKYVSWNLLEMLGLQGVWLEISFPEFIFQTIKYHIWNVSNIVGAQNWVHYLPNEPPQPNFNRHAHISFFPDFFIQIIMREQAQVAKFKSRPKSF